ncbi:MAG: hypothetical protein HYV40_01840 [Candidatus Levybacteria bacterium]|nr:hypothetical protein [Candidatus Levybacteria bacterium]
MRRKLVLAGILLLVILLLTGLGFLASYLYNPTLQSYLMVSRVGEVGKRNDFLRTVYPKVPKIDGYRIFRLSRYGEEAPYVEIRDCFPVPYITRAKRGNELSFRNTSGTKKTIKLLNTLYIIEPWQEKSLSITFPAVPAIFEYYCDNSPLPVGFIYAVNK